MPKDAALTQQPLGGPTPGDSRRSFARSASSRPPSSPRVMGEATDSAPGTPSVVQHSVAGDLHMASRGRRVSASFAEPGESVREGKKQASKEKRVEKSEARKEKQAERAEDFDDDPNDGDFFQVG